MPDGDSARYVGKGLLKAWHRQRHHRPEADRRRPHRTTLQPKSGPHRPAVSAHPC